MTMANSTVGLIVSSTGPDLGMQTAFLIQAPIGLTPTGIRSCIRVDNRGNLTAGPIVSNAGPDLSIKTAPLIHLGMGLQVSRLQV